MKPVLFVLLDAFAEWECAYLASALRSDPFAARFLTRFASLDGRAVRSIGGMCVQPDCAAVSLPGDCAALILVGGMNWQDARTEQLVPLIHEAVSRGVLVGAICNAVSFLAAHGFLDAVRHTGNTREVLEAWGGANYRGGALYEARQAVCDGGFVTANGSAALEFTRECLLALDKDASEAVIQNYLFYKQGFYHE